MKIIKLYEERQIDIDAFNGKFGEGSFDKFNKLKGRLKNNNISVDIVYHTKNTPVDKMSQLLSDAENRVVKDETGQTKNNYKLVAENEHYKVLDILDWETSMNLGNDTKWCITGRYQTNGEVKPSQAKQYFNQYKENGIKHFLFFMPKGNEEKYCLCLTNSDKFEFWNAADESQEIGNIPLDKNLPEFEYDGFTLKMPEIINGLIIVNNTVTKAFDKNIKNADIPYGVTKIGRHAFEDCTLLSSVTIPDSVAKIGYCAFSGCESLSSITIPNSVTEIDFFAFEFCTSLSSITIPNSVTEIGNQAFQHCTSLSSITIPDSVIEISNGAFYGCKSLKSITIPNRVTKIGDDAFNRCESLKSIIIPNSVTKIGRYVFDNCDKLTIRTNNDYVIDYCEDNNIKYERDDKIK